MSILNFRDSDLDENEKIRPCEAGDRIIVKMKGLPAWPAKVYV